MDVSSSLTVEANFAKVLTDLFRKLYPPLMLHVSLDLQVLVLTAQVRYTCEKMSTSHHYLVCMSCL